MGEGSPKKPHRVAAPPTRYEIALLREGELSICSACLAWGTDLDSYWSSPRGQRPRRNGFCGSGVGLLGTEFQFTAEGLLGRVRRGPGELGLRAGHHEGQAGGGGGGSGGGEGWTGPREANAPSKKPKPSCTVKAALGAFAFLVPHPRG